METAPIKIAQKKTTSALQPNIKSKVLLNNQTSLNIEHEGQIYILRVTRQGKLILTK